MQTYNPHRNVVTRQLDGKAVNVARFRGQLFVCANACCCGREDLTNAPIDTDFYHEEWTRRRLRNFVHLTVGGCLGPCALANVNLLVFDGQALWFHSVNSNETIAAIFDYIEAMLDAGEVIEPPTALQDILFTASTWQDRPDGALVEDRRQWRGARLRPDATPSCELEEPSGTLSMEAVEACLVPERLPDGASERLLRALEGELELPRKNGELVFEAPWQGRVFGMANALHDGGCFTWDEFRERLVVAVRAAEESAAPFEYYTCWLAAFEAILSDLGIVQPADIEERTAEFEFGERSEIY